MQEKSQKLVIFSDFMGVMLPKLWRLCRSLVDGAWRLLFSGRGCAATDSSHG